MKPAPAGLEVSMKEKRQVSHARIKGADPERLAAHNVNKLKMMKDAYMSRGEDGLVNGKWECPNESFTARDLYSFDEVQQGLGEHAHAHKRSPFSRGAGGRGRGWGGGRLWEGGMVPGFLMPAHPSARPQ